MKTLSEQLIDDVIEGLRVWVKRDAVMLTEGQMEERATNIVAGLLGGYSIVPYAPLGAPPDWETKMIDGIPVGHSWSCQCTPCHTAKFNRRSS